MRRLLLLLVLLSLLGVAPAAAQAAGPSATRAALDRHLRWAGSASGALVVDLDTGEQLYARRPDVGRVPASVTKLFTTSAALLRWGSAATLDTEVLADVPPDPDGVVRGNVYLRGAGDPTLSAGGLRALASTLALEAGVSAVTGRVIGDESRFDTLRGGPDSAWGISRWVGPLGALVVDRGRTGRRVPYWQRDPARFAARAFARGLKGAGVAGATVRGARAGTAPTSAIVLAGRPSPPVARLVALTNRPSDNFAAELLLKALGADVSGAGTTRAGTSAVRSLLRRLGVSLRMVDGSGLSRANRVTPRNVVRLLGAMRRQPAYGAFHDSLAVAGRSGTLRERMRRGPARNRCRGKTGTLARVSALAGYCRTRGGRTVAFAILLNGIDTWSAKRLEDRIVGALATYSP